jgi:hypothetical protein
MNILEAGHEVFRGPDENNSNISRSGCDPNGQAPVWDLVVICGQRFEGRTGIG